jgi:hypothetical protein
MSDTQISIINKDFDATIQAFEKIKGVANYLATSETFVSDFIMKKADGTNEIDETTGKPKINVADVAICLMTGHELGLDIGGSLLYGRKLNRATYMSVMKGRSLGIDLATAIEKVITITTKTGNTVSYTMVDIISSKLLENGVEFLPFIKNYAPFYIYKNPAGEELELDKILDKDTDELLPEYFLVHAGLVKDDVDKAKAEGKQLVTRIRHGYYTKGKFVRKYPDGHVQVHYQRFSTLDAERQELLPTFDEKGILIQGGKDNWIKSTPQMLANRVISIAGRIICADKLHGIYTREEIVSAGLVKESEAPVVDTVAEVV